MTTTNPTSNPVPSAATHVTSSRNIKRVWKSAPTIEGAGVHLKRAFGACNMPQFDPFLLLDDLGSSDPDDYAAGFPWHPHRGIDTITYLLDGELEHSDTTGNGGIIRAGDAQWLTTGSGVMHQEMLKGSAKGRLCGIQLWANLPAKHKMVAPRYHDVTQNTIPSVRTADGSLVRVIAGEVQGMRGPVRDALIEPEFLDVSVPAGRTFRHIVQPGHTVFAYVLEGEGYFENGRDPFAHEVVGVNYFDNDLNSACTPGSLILYEVGGAQIAVTAVRTSVRFLLVSGRPLHEPVFWYGSIVMSTREQLKTAFDEFQNGTFVKIEGAI